MGNLRIMIDDFPEFERQDLIALCKLTGRMGWNEISAVAKDSEQALKMHKAVKKLFKLLTELGYNEARNRIKI